MLHDPLAQDVATIDHISRVRFDLNIIVAGWNAKEIRMFGVDPREHDVRYDMADDWITLCKRLWTTAGEFDRDGPHFPSPAANLIAGYGAIP